MTPGFDGVMGWSEGRQAASRRLRRWVWVSLVCGLASGGLVPVLAAQQARNGVPPVGTEAPFDVSTPTGTLRVLKQGEDFTPTFVVQWNGKVLNTFTNDRNVRVLGISGEKTTLLLEFEGQGSDCPYHYRFLDLTAQPEPALTRDVGDCSEAHEVTAHPNGLSLTLAGWTWPQRKVRALKWTFESDGPGKAGVLRHEPVSAKEAGAAGN